MEPAIPSIPANNGVGLEDYLRAEQIFLLSLNREDQAAGIIAVAVAADVLHNLYPAWLMDLWIGLSSFMVLLCVYLARRCNASVLTAQSVRSWARLFTLCAIITGLLWGLTGTAILLSSNPGIQSFVIVLTGAILAGGINGNAAYRPAVLGLGLGIQMPVIIALFACDDRIHAGCGILLIIFTALMINGALKFNRVIADNIRMRFSQQQLLAHAQSSEAGMAEAQQLAKAGSWSLDLQTLIITLSPEAYHAFGVDPANAAPDFGLIMARVHPEDKAMVDAHVANTRTRTSLTDLDHRLVMDNYTIKYLHITAKTVFDASGKALRVNGSVQDVTDRRLIEERLQFANTLLNIQIEEQKQTQARLEFANILHNIQMEASRDGILVVDSDDTIIALNQRYGEMSRARFDDLLGQNFAVSVARARPLVKDLGAFLHRVSAIHANPMVASEAEFETTDGRFLSRYMTPLRAASGDYLGRAWFYTDITERKQASETLAYRDQLLHTVTVATAIAVGAAALEDGVAAALAEFGGAMRVDRIIVMQKMPEHIPPLAVRFQWESPAAHKSFKLTETGVHQFNPQEMALWRAPLEHGEPVTAQQETAHGAVRAMMELHGTLSCLLVPISVGGQFWGFLGIDACAAPRRWALSEIETVGILAGIIGSLIVRETARIALATSEQRFRLLTSTAKDAVIVSDQQGHILQWNRGAEDMFGYTAAEAVGQQMIRLLVPQNQKADIIPRLLTVNETVGLTMEMPVRRRDGTLTAIEFSTSGARFNGQLELFTIVRDISERKIAEQKLQFANILLGTQMEASPDGIMVVDANWILVSYNQRLAEIWNLAEEHLQPGGDNARRAHIFAQVAAPEAHIARIKYLLDHPDIIGEDEIVTNNGRFIERYSRSLMSPAGQYLGRAWFFTDVTARKTAEQRLQFANILLNTQMEAAPGGILVVDANRNIISCNERFAEIWRIPAAEARPGNDAALRAHIRTQVIGPDTYQARIDHLVEHPEAVGQDEVLTTDDRILERYTRSLISPAGALLGRVWFYSDVTGRKAAERNLQFTNILLRTHMEASPDGILVVDANRNMVSCNRRFTEIWRFPDGEARPGNDAAMRAHIFGQVAATEAYQARVKHLVDHPEEVGEDELLTTDGRTIERYSRSMFSASGELIGRVSFFSDVTERKRAEQKLLIANTLLKTQMEAAPDGIYVVDAAGQILTYNQRFAEMWGIPSALLERGDTCAVREQSAAMTTDPAQYQGRIAYLNQHPEETVDDELELTDGRIFERHSVSLQTAEQETLGRVWFCRDVTARRAAEALALRHARYDVLTGLANRAIFVEAIDQAIAHARRDNTCFAVLFLDLDHFKDVNDTLGHPAGDALLKGVAARLLSATRETDTVGRFGGDEFAVILYGIKDAAGAAFLAERLIAAINVPLTIERNTVHIRASIGIETFSPSAEDSETLLAHADVALYRAKAEGRGTFRFFTAAMDRDVRDRVTLGTELREALGAGELLLLYQPQVDARTGAITGVEALIRWRHPQRGLLTPSAFIEAAETTGAIAQLGHFVLWTACRQAAAWLAEGNAPPRISFNVSALQFKAPRTLEADIMDALAETGLPPGMLELELTESALMSTSRENGEMLQRLKEYGVKLAIDDFGTGYSSFEYLRRFPADHIKIAQTFIKDIETVASDAKIVRAIIGLANELNISTIAEGIETRGQFDLITSWGCTKMQGFYLSRPVPPERITGLVKSGMLLPAIPEFLYPDGGPQ